jgi:hypothetical protein
MSASSPVLRSTNVEDRVEDEKIVEEPASDANTMVGKDENETENGTETEPKHEAIAEEDQLSADEYPKGFQFFFILISLVLSIFMVALDLVRLFSQIFPQTNADSSQRPLSQQLYQRSRMTSTVFPRLDGTARPSS